MRSYIYVGIQLILFILYFVTVSDYAFVVNFLLRIGFFGIAIAGFIIIGLAILQLNKNLSPFPTPIKEGSLIQTGLYKYIRHPIYTGIILTTIGFGLSMGSGWKTCIGILLWILFYFKSRYEESLLLHKYPGYKQYRMKTGRFFPYL